MSDAALRLDRRAFITAATAAGLSLHSGKSKAQDYPSRQIRIVVPFPAAGGPLDTSARAVADGFQTSFGQPGILDNRAGAGGLIGTEAVFRAPPDGYTILCSPQFLFAVGHLLYPRSTFDVRQMEPISMIAQYPAVLVVRPSLAVHNPAELIAFAKANPGKLTYGSQGVGTTGHLTLEQIKKDAQVDILHVPFRGSAPAVTGILSEQIDVLADTLLNTRANIEAGKLRLIGVGTIQRLKEFPDVPAVSETLPGFESIASVGVVAPPKTPAKIVQTIGDMINRSLSRPEVRQRFAALDLEPLGLSPDETRAYLAKLTSRWAPVIESAKIRIE